MHFHQPPLDARAPDSFWLHFTLCAIVIWLAKICPLWVHCARKRGHCGHLWVIEFCTHLFNPVYFCSLVYFCIDLFTFAKNCLLLLIFVHFCLFLSTFAYCCSLLLRRVYFCLDLFTSVETGLLFIQFCTFFLFVK